MISTASFFFGQTDRRTRMGRTEGEGVSCAAVLLVRLPPPLPVLHPGKRGGYKGKLENYRIKVCIKICKIVIKNQKSKPRNAGKPTKNRIIKREGSN